MKLHIPPTGVNTNNYNILPGKNPKKPKSWAGNFAVVTPADRKGEDGSVNKAAMRWFLGKTPSHITQITSFINNNPHSSLVGCKMYRNMLSLKDGENVDMMEMDFVEGPTLDDWIEQTLLSGSVDKIAEMAEGLRTITNELVSMGFYHGDLSHSNIMVDQSNPTESLINQIRLIDYDSVLVKGIKNPPDTKEAGHPNFQHPSRKASRFTMLEDVYFTILGIYLSLIAISENPNLWQAGLEKRVFHSKGDNLIFQHQRGDLENTNTELWDELGKINYPRDTKKAYDCFKHAVNTTTLVGSDFLSKIEEWFSTGTMPTPRPIPTPPVPIPPGPSPPNPTPTPGPLPSPKPIKKRPKPLPSPKPRKKGRKPLPSPKPTKKRLKPSPSPKPKKRGSKLLDRLEEQVPKKVQEANIEVVGDSNKTTAEASSLLKLEKLVEDLEAKKQAGDTRLAEVAQALEAKAKKEAEDKPSGVSSAPLPPPPSSANENDLFSKYKWKEEILSAVMDNHGIEESARDKFLGEVIKSLPEETNYIKKSIFVEVAKKWSNSITKKAGGSSKSRPKVRSEFKKSKKKRRAKTVPKKLKAKTIPVPFEKLSGKKIILDGTNVLYESSVNAGVLELSPLQEFINLIEDSGAESVSIVFDASTRHKFAEEDKPKFNEMINDNKENYTIAPKKTEADSIILNIAEKTQSIVVTNDFYLDYEELHPEAYIWFKTNHITISYLMGIWTMNTTQENKFIQ